MDASICNRNVLVPTTDKMDHFNFKDTYNNPDGAYAIWEKKDGNIWTLVIRKPCHDFSDDARMKELTYDVKDFIFHKYHIQYRRSHLYPWESIPTPGLKKVNISAYAVTQSGLWFIWADVLHFIDAKSGQIATFQLSKAIMELTLTPSGKLGGYRVTGIREKERNRFYSYCMGDYEGYDDVYEVTLEKRVLIQNPSECLQKKLLIR